MKKLKIPKIVMPEIKNEELAIKNFSKFMEMAFYSDLEPEYDFNVYGLYASANIEYNYNQNEYCIYAFISDSDYYYDNAIVKTKDYYFHTYKQYQSAVKKMNKDLVNGWKQWVKELYEEV